jgi:hypothetical protein
VRQIELASFREGRRGEEDEKGRRREEGEEQVGLNRESNSPPRTTLTPDNGIASVVAHRRKGEARGGTEGGRQQAARLDGI